MWFAFINHLTKDIEYIYMFDNGHEPFLFSTNDDFFRELGFLVVGFGG